MIRSMRIQYTYISVCNAFGAHICLINSNNHYSKCLSFVYAHSLSGKRLRGMLKLVQRETRSGKKVRFSEFCLVCARPLSFFFLGATYWTIQLSVSMINVPAHQRKRSQIRITHLSFSKCVKTIEIGDFLKEKK